MTPTHPTTGISRGSRAPSLPGPQAFESGRVRLRLDEAPTATPVTTAAPAEVRSAGVSSNGNTPSAAQQIRRYRPHHDRSLRADTSVTRIHIRADRAAPHQCRPTWCGAALSPERMSAGVHDDLPTFYHLTRLGGCEQTRHWIQPRNAFRRLCAGQTRSYLSSPVDAGGRPGLATTSKPCLEIAESKDH
jgi:hypothetical protein